MRINPPKNFKGPSKKQDKIFQDKKAPLAPQGGSEL